MSRFKEQLDRVAGDIKAPPNPPMGDYTLMITKPHELKEGVAAKSGVNYDVITFTIGLVAPHEDVDQEELAEFGDVSKVTLQEAFWFNTEDGEDIAFERTMNNLKVFCEAFGAVESDDQPIGEILANMPKMTAVGTLVHEPSPNDPERFFARLNSFRAEE